MNVEQKKSPVLLQSEPWTCLLQRTPAVLAVLRARGVLISSRGVGRCSFQPSFSIASLQHKTEHLEPCSLCRLELQHFPRVTKRLELRWAGCELTEPTKESSSPHPQKNPETKIFDSFENSYRASRPLRQLLSRLKTFIVNTTVSVLLCNLSFHFFIFKKGEIISFSYAN